jgi:hypothetical protein
VTIFELHLHYGIGQVSPVNMIEGRLKKCPLLCRSNVGNDNDHARVQGLLPVKGQKVGAIIRDERVLLLPDDSHDLPILGSAESSVGDMVGDVAGGMGYLHQRGVKTLVDQELQVRLAGPVR